MAVPIVDAPCGTVSPVCVAYENITMTTMTYTMHWREREKPDNRGTGLPISDGKEAAQVCREHNALYPKFTHWAEREKTHEQDV